jgi:hypothetical protein
MSRKPEKYGTKIMYIKNSRIIHTTHTFIMGNIPVEIHFQLQTGNSTNQPRLLSTSLATSNTEIKISQLIFVSSMTELLSVLQEKGLIYIMTMMENKREVPKEFLP